MTSYYKGNNIGLNYDAANATWSFTNEPNDFIDPDSFSTADPAFDYTPPAATTTEEAQEDDFNPCPLGYIYNNTLKQCVPDPAYQAPAYAGEPGREGERDYAGEAQENYVDFREMSYDEMVTFGKNKGFFNAAGTFIGAPESTAYPGIKAIAQFGLDSQANRFAINFAKKGGKVWNPNEPSFKGNLYIPKTGDLAKFISTGSFDYNKKIDSFKTASMNKITQIAQFDLAKTEREDYFGEKREQELHDQKLKQERIKTQQAQFNLEKEEREQAERDLTASELDKMQKDADRKRKEAAKKKGQQEQLKEQISRQAPIPSTSLPPPSVRERKTYKAPTSKRAEKKQQREYSVPKPGTVGTSGPPGRNYPSPKKEKKFSRKTGFQH